jgi:hypothetical protein
MKKSTKRRLARASIATAAIISALGAGGAAAARTKRGKPVVEALKMYKGKHALKLIRPSFSIRSRTYKRESGTISANSVSEKEPFTVYRDPQDVITQRNRLVKEGKGFTLFEQLEGGKTYELIPLRQKAEPSTHTLPAHMRPAASKLPL